VGVGGAPYLEAGRLPPGALGPAKRSLDVGLDREELDNEGIARREVYVVERSPVWAFFKNTTL
jgi:hypothetical protein